MWVPWHPPIKLTLSKINESIEILVITIGIAAACKQTTVNHSNKNNFLSA